MLLLFLREAIFGHVWETAYEHVCQRETIVSTHMPVKVSEQEDPRFQDQLSYYEARLL